MKLVNLTEGMEKVSPAARLLDVEWAIRNSLYRQDGGMVREAQIIVLHHHILKIALWGRRYNADDSSELPHNAGAFEQEYLLCCNSIAEARAAVLVIFYRCANCTVEENGITLAKRVVQSWYGTSGVSKLLSELISHVPFMAREAYLAAQRPVRRGLHPASLLDAAH